MEAGTTSCTAFPGDAVPAPADTFLGALRRPHGPHQVTLAQRTPASSRQTVRAKSTVRAMRVCRRVIAIHLERMRHVVQARALTGDDVTHGT